MEQDFNSDVTSYDILILEDFKAEVYRNTKIARFVLLQVCLLHCNVIFTLILIYKWPKFNYFVVKGFI